MRPKTFALTIGMLFVAFIIDLLVVQMFFVVHASVDQWFRLVLRMASSFTSLRDARLPFALLEQGKSNRKETI